MKSTTEIPIRGISDYTRRRMYRVWLGLVLFCIVGTSATMAQTGGNLPKISLELPLQVPSKDVQVTYFMSGPFGGYGHFVRPQKNRLTYEIDASVGGVAASGIKLIAYLPGCEILKMDISALQALTTRLLECRPVGTVTLRGKILPGPLLRDGTEIEVLYLALWAYEFFGIRDGMVVSFPLVRVGHDEKGNFEVQLPDLAGQGLGESELEFILRETATGNIVSFLRPRGTGTNPIALNVSPSYPDPIQFIAKTK